jgi:serine/threonine protein kinase
MRGPVLEALAPIGAGGMGEVNKACDTRLDRLAIKVLPSNLSSNPELRARLDREAKAISSLSHPNIFHYPDVAALPSPDDSCSSAPVPLRNRRRETLKTLICNSLETRAAYWLALEMN